MAEDARRFDDLVRTVADLRTRLDDVRTTLLARVAAPDPAIGREARYVLTGSQNIPSGADQRLYFNAAEYVSDDVTATAGDATAGSMFTLNRAGLWRLSANVRIAGGGTAAAERYLCISQGASTAVNRYASSGVTPGAAGPVTLSCSSDERFSAGATVALWMFQGSGASLALINTWRSVNFSLTWLRP